MFLIATRVAPSTIHGLGVFACEPVAAGAVVWRYHPGFDRTLSDADVEAAPEAVRAFLETYAYRAVQLDGALVLSGDHARFLNHSDHPNTEEGPLLSRARRAIAVGEEITCDYGAFCTDWSGFA